MVASDGSAPFPVTGREEIIEGKASGVAFPWESAELNVAKSDSNVDHVLGKQAELYRSERRESTVSSRTADAEDILDHFEIGSEILDVG